MLHRHDPEDVLTVMVAAAVHGDRVIQRMRAILAEQERAKAAGELEAMQAAAAPRERAAMYVRNIRARLEERVTAEEFEAEIRRLERGIG